MVYENCSSAKCSEVLEFSRAIASDVAETDEAYNTAAVSWYNDRIIDSRNETIKMTEKSGGQSSSKSTSSWTKSTQVLMQFGADEIKSVPARFGSRANININAYRERKDSESQHGPPPSPTWKISSKENKAERRDSSVTISSVLVKAARDRAEAEEAAAAQAKAVQEAEEKERKKEKLKAAYAERQIQEEKRLKDARAEQVEQAKQAEANAERDRVFAEERAEEKAKYVKERKERPNYAIDHAKYTELCSVLKSNLKKLSIEVQMKEFPDFFSWMGEFFLSHSDLVKKMTQDEDLLEKVKIYGYTPSYKLYEGIVYFYAVFDNLVEDVEQLPLTMYASAVMAGTVETRKNTWEKVLVSQKDIDKDASDLPRILKYVELSHHLKNYSKSALTKYSMSKWYKKVQKILAAAAVNMKAKAEAKLEAQKRMTEEERGMAQEASIREVLKGKSKAAEYLDL